MIDSLLIKTFDTNDFFYIVMENTDLNLIDFLKLIPKPFTLEEIREIFFKINQNIKIFNENSINYEINISNIMLPIDLKNHQKVKLIGKKEINTEKISVKQIYNLGEIIYFLIFQTNYLNDNEIIRNKRINSILNKDLKQLIKGLLQKDMNKEIEWEDYLNNIFFRQMNKDKEEIFNIKCKKHLNYFSSFCENCKKNICDLCAQDHLEHKLIHFNEIGLNDFEIYTLKLLMKQINQNIQNLIKLKDDINTVLQNFQKIKTNCDIFQIDHKNNFKNYYFDLLNLIKEKSQFYHFDLIDLSKKKEKENLVQCKFEVLKNHLTIPFFGFKEIKKIFIEKEEITPELFQKYQFEKEGKYEIKIVYNDSFKDLSNIFDNYKPLTSLDLFNLDTSDIINMENMFSFCETLKSLNLSSFVTNNVSNMSHMFYNCSKLTNLDLFNFNTEKVTNMNNMFYNCSSLKHLKLSNFNTNQVKDMNNMFYGCFSLKYLDLSTFITNNVINMNYMFYNCSSLKSLDLSTFITDKVKNMSYMFYNCSSLKSLNISNFITNNVSNMDHMFYNCSSLISLDLLNFITNNVSNMNNMFNKCTSLKSLNLSSFVTNNVINMDYMFYNCISLKSLELTNFNTINVKSMDHMLANLDKNCKISTQDEKINQMWEELRT